MINLTEQQIRQIENDLNRVYEIRDKLGQGSFGTVLKTWHKGLQRYRAVKVFTYDAEKVKISYDHWRDILAREAVLASRLTDLRNPHIVQTYEYYSPEQTPSGSGYLIMEFIEGSSLRELINNQRGKGLDPELVCDIIQKIARALDYIHAQQVVHRDIKPDNIRFKGKDTSHPILIDFGIAVEVRQGGSSGTVAGTFTYMAPEVLDGKTERWADLYSLGVVAYEMLIGKMRDDRRFQYDLIASPALQAVIKKAVAPGVSERFQSGREFADSFRAALDGRPVIPDDRLRSSSVERPGTIIIPRPLTKRTNPLMQLGWVALLVLIGAALAGFLGLNRLSMSATPTSRITEIAPSPTTVTIVATATLVSTTPVPAFPTALPTETAALPSPTETLVTAPTDVDRTTVTAIALVETAPPTLESSATDIPTFAPRNTEPAPTETPVPLTAPPIKSPAVVTPAPSDTAARAIILLLPTIPTEIPTTTPTYTVTATYTLTPSPTTTLTETRTPIPADIATLTYTPVLTATPGWTIRISLLSTSLQANTAIDCDTLKPAFKELEGQANLSETSSAVKKALQSILKAGSSTRNFYKMCLEARTSLLSVDAGKQRDLDKMRREIKETLDLVEQADTE